MKRVRQLTWLSARVLVRALPLAVILIAVAYVALFLLGSGEDLFITTLFINVTLVLGLQIFIGNTGVISFGSPAFIAIGAYVSSILTMPVATKMIALPNLPETLSHVEVGLPLAVAAVILATGVGALPVGIPIVRLTGAAASIATFAFLVITNGILVGAVSFTRGTQTFFGVPPLTTLDLAMWSSIVFMLVALTFRLSATGLQLQASAEDPLAAAASGIDVRRLRIYAWVLSAVVSAVGGVLLAHMLTTFAPSTFYLAQTLSLLTMLILGGARTVTGAITGTIVVTTVFEVLRRAENGFDLGFVNFSGLYGLQQLGLGVFLLVAIWLRRDGLLGDRELVLDINKVRDLLAQRRRQMLPGRPNDPDGG